MREIIAGLRPRLMAIFEHLHAHPEVSWKEYGTKEYLLPILEEFGCRIRTFEDHAGITADLGEGTPKVAVRGDMDALWQEVDGVEQANHSCGHDAHMTMALGTMMTLHALGEKVGGSVRILFQPAEEKGAGALQMVADGALDGVDYLYGVHLRPVEDLPNHTAGPAIVHGSATFWEGTINGHDAHGSRPHLNVNAIQVGAELVHLLAGVKLNPMIPHSVKMTRFQAGGESANIIPGKAQFSLDLRAQTNASMRELMEKVDGVIKHVAQMRGVEIALKKGHVTAAAEVHPEAQKLMHQAILETHGEEGTRPPVVTAGGDDFHFYTIKRPDLKATMLALGCDLRPGLHHPHMTFDRENLFVGTEILTRAVLHTLNQ